LQNHLISTCHREPRGFWGAAIPSHWEIATLRSPDHRRDRSIRNDTGFCKGLFNPFSIVVV